MDAGGTTKDHVSTFKLCSGTECSGGETKTHFVKLYWTFPMGDTLSFPEKSGIWAVLSFSSSEAMPSCFPWRKSREKCVLQSLKGTWQLGDQPPAVLTIFKPFLCQSDLHTRISAEGGRYERHQRQTLQQEHLDI